MCALAAICQEVLARGPPTPHDSGTVGYYWAGHKSALAGHESAPVMIVGTVGYYWAGHESALTGHESAPVMIVYCSHVG